MPLGNPKVIADGEITVAKLEATLKQVVLPMHVFGTWAVDGDGAAGGGGGMAGCVLGDISETEAAATLAKVYDKGTGTTVNLSASAFLTGWTADWQLTADAASEEIGDYCAFGATVPFAEIAFELGGALATWGGNGGVWEYWGLGGGPADWLLLSNFYDNTDITAPATGLRAFQQAGALMFVPPSDWVEVALGGVTAYWIRYRITATQVTQTPVKTKEHQIITPVTGGEGTASVWAAPFDGTITSIHLHDGTTGTLHTDADVKFFLMDFTTGAHCDLLTFSQDIRHFDFGPSPNYFSFSAGDILGVVVIQEDGNNEVTNAVLELTITRS